MALVDEQKKLWEESFEAQIAIGAYNTSPVEALVRNVAYYLRARYSPEQNRTLHFLEMGCGAGPNLVWLAQKGIKVSGVDIAANALKLAKQNLERNGYTDRVGQLVECSVTKTPFADGSIDGVLESCVYQHLDAPMRKQAFDEVARVLKKGGLFVGNMLATDHTTFQSRKAEQLKEDPGSLFLADNNSKIHLTSMGFAHFFTKDEYAGLLPGFATVDPLLQTYDLPQEEAKLRGYDHYRQAMWTVFAVK